MTNVKWMMSRVPAMVGESESKLFGLEKYQSREREVVRCAFICVLCCYNM